MLVRLAMDAAAMSVLLYALWIVPGFLLGSLHFHGLRRNAALYAAGRVGPALVLQLLRMGVTAGGLFLAGRQGAWPLLCALAGLLVARLFLVRPVPTEARS
jgi:F1F0 ATPase subunit 2